ncbi:universal stress protein [Streptomyces justiciae]|uniref:Universal stress protein n=1 Tax=Streptomyces justiciae TaxID=2780140 RepID=A0ABU3LL88_9ACTN|nr:universal stress protein [Streptomyces justiciae]MDT7839908.1 universal stress protein [Streptomyces justiciae]
MLRHVTAGVDATPESLAAVHWAAREALRRGAGLRLVHAPRRSAAAVPPTSGAPEPEGARVLERVVAGVRAAHPGLPITARIGTDSPVAALLAAADEADLLVLGSRGRDDVTGGVGAVGEPVVARSATPVVLVRAGEGCAGEHLPAPDGVSPEEIPEIPYRDVVLGLDISRPCDELIEFAFASARLRATVLRVIHASPPPMAPAGGATERPLEGALAARLRPWREKFPTVPVVETVTGEAAADELVRVSGGAALTVVGRGTGDGRPDRPHLGPVTRAVLHRARCPVAVVPHV